jgi:uncharacterized repeat protein (TIGR01451 family)
MKKKIRAIPLTLAILLGAQAASADTFAPGSLIVPMDTSYQDAGMLKAYGLVYSLLRQGVPVRWIIKQGKAFQQADFTAAGTDVKTLAAIPSHAYRGGPFVIDSANAAAAMPIITAWQASNPTTNVHLANVAFMGDVARYLVAAPRVAMHADGNQAIAISYLNAAGIPDSNLDPWPANSPDLLTPAEIAGPTTTSHHDGALFDAEGAPLYCQFMSMHWGVNEAAALPEVVAEVRDFLHNNPVHFFAECQAVNAFENQAAYGHFLTPNGFVNKAQPANVDYYNADLTFAQIDGAFGTTGGSEPAYALPPGDMYKAGNITMITAQGAPEGTWDLWMTGYVDGICKPGVASCGTVGKVSYLGGHQYSTNVPISSNPKTNGVRMFLNSLFDSNCASAEGLPKITLDKTAPATTLSADLTFSLDYANAGPSVALGAVLTDPLPAGSTFVSATGGGVFAGGVVTWSLGNLGVTETGNVSVTITLPALGTYTNTASLAYKVGLNPLTKTSNTTSTLYDKDTDGDGVLDAIDTCPTVANPAQDLSTDVANCGKCGLVCAVAGGTPACLGGACAVASCDAGFSDCNGLYPDGCEYAGSTCPAPECASAADCDDKDPCTMDACAGGQCTHAAADCDGGAGTGTATVGAGGTSASSSGVGGAGGVSTGSVGAGGAGGTRETSGGATGPGDTGACGCRAAGDPAPAERAWIVLGAALVGAMGVRRSPRRRPSR